MKWISLSSRHWTSSPGVVECRDESLVSFETCCTLIQAVSNSWSSISWTSGMPNAIGETMTMTGRPGSKITTFSRKRCWVSALKKRTLYSPRWSPYHCPPLDFGYTSLDVAHALNISQLHSLTLRSCPDAGTLLKAIVDSGTPKNLSTLELVISHASDGEYNKQADEEWFVPFFNSFRGLRDLYLEVENGRGVAAMQRYWPSIFHHHQTLRRLVYHEQRMENYSWLLDCSIAIEDDKVLDLFTQMSLECIALCLVPAIQKVRTSVYVC